MKLCICTKFHEYILNGFGDVKHKSTSLMVLKTIQWTLFFKPKTSKGIILLKFRCRRFLSCRADTIFILKISKVHISAKM